MLRIQDNCRSAYQRVHADQDIEQGREVEEQQRKSNFGGELKNIYDISNKIGQPDIYQVTAGVREYFNVMLSSQLLYSRGVYTLPILNVGNSVRQNLLVGPIWWCFGQKITPLGQLWVPFQRYQKFGFPLKMRKLKMLQLVACGVSIQRSWWH